MEARIAGKGVMDWTAGIEVIRDGKGWAITAVLAAGYRREQIRETSHERGT